MSNELSKAIEELRKLHEIQLQRAAMVGREQCRAWTIRAFILGMIVGAGLLAIASVLPSLSST